jgi:hypothetical protein
MAKPKKQLAIAGTETKGNKEVEAAAEAYVEVRDERMKLTEKEVEARDTLVRVMEKHKLDVYRDENVDPPLLVTLEPGVAKVKVRREDDNTVDDGWK